MCDVLFRMEYSLPLNSSIILILFLKEFAVMFYGHRYNSIDERPCVELQEIHERKASATCELCAKRWL